MERTIYEVEAELVDWKVQLNGSYHLNLKGKTGATMLANCLDPRLLVEGESRWAKQIATVYKEIEEKLKPTQAYSHGKVPVRITGIGFFNQVRGGMRIAPAPSGIELTPVLSIEWL